MGKRLGGFVPRPRLIPEIDGNCSGGREKGNDCVKELRNPIKPKISGGYVSKERRLFIAGELVVPTCQTSGHAGLQGNGNSRLLGATGRRGQPNSTVNSLKTASPPKHPGTTVDFKPTTSRGIRNVANTLRLPNVSNTPPSGFIPR